MRTAQMRRRSGEVQMQIVPKVVPQERVSGVRLCDDTHEGPHREEHRKIAESAQAASIGFDVCARRAGTKAVAERMTWLAAEARAIAEHAAARVPGGVRGPTTSERMRWEWLASTAALLDGGTEGRLAAESSRLVAIAEESAAHIDDDVLLVRIARLATTVRAAAA